MDTIEQASSLNVEAIHLLESGKCLEAISTLKRGIAGLKVHSVPSRVGDPSIGYTDSYLTAQPVRTAAGEGTKRKTLHQAQSFVFTRPLLFSVSSTKHESAFMAASSILLFNLGLACQTLSSIPPSRAAKCYNLAFSIASRFTSDDGIHALLQCLILNNLAHLHFEECEYAKSHQCMQNMQLLVRTGCLDGSTASRYLSKDDTDELKLNLLCLKKPTAARAA
jgi:hypothetical protein